MKKFVGFCSGLSAVGIERVGGELRGHASRAGVRGWVIAVMVWWLGAEPRVLGAELGSLFDLERASSLAGVEGGGMGREPSWVLRADSVRALAQWKRGDVWEIPTLQGVPWRLRVLDTGVPSSQATTVIGEIVSDPGSAVLLTHQDGTVACTLRTRSGEAWRMVPGPGRRYRLSRIDEASEPECGNGPSGNRSGLPERVHRALAAGASGGNAPVVLDMAFLCTAAAAEGAGGLAGMRTLTELAILEANDAYTRSGARLRLRSVGVFESGYRESGDLVTDLDRLSRKGEGWLDEVHPLRESVAADAVCLVVEYEDSQRLAGMANQLIDTTADRLERGFTVCVRPYFVGNYTLAHEVGHLLGCDHDRDNTVGGALQGWSYGNRINVEGVQYRTVMAYRPGVQFPYFSSPEVRFRGVPTGVASGAGAADNVRTMNFTAPLVAAVREPSRRVGFENGRWQTSESSGITRVRLLRSGVLDAASVVLSARSGSAIEGTDFDAFQRRIVLPANQPTVDVDLTLTDNARVDGPRSFTLVLSEPSSGMALGPWTQAMVEIRDDEIEAGALVDSGFGSKPGTDYGVAALAFDGDQRVLVGGSFLTANGESHRRLARFTADGRVDSSFAPAVKYEVLAMARWPDGRIAIGGRFNTVNDVRLNHVAVLRSDGSLEPGFEFDAGTDAPVAALQALADGKLLLGGAFTNVQGRASRRVARLLPSGQPDPTFRSDQPSPDDEVRALAVDAAGRVILGGRFRKVGTRSRPGVDRWLPNGAVDLAFVADGTADGPVHALALDSRGGVWAGGEFTRFLGAAAGRVVRLSETGALDSTVRTGTGADGAIWAVALGADGRVWIGGAFRRFDGRVRNGVARLHVDGALDESFDPGVGPNDRVLAVLPRPSGGAVIGGWFTQVNGVDRGGVAALLDGAPEAPTFAAVRLGPGVIEWEARGTPGQIYEVEQSMDLFTWRGGVRVSAGSGMIRESTPRAESAAGFLRLRRRVE